MTTPKKKTPHRLTDAQAFALIRRKIRRFEQKCRAEEYTDTGDAWELFHEIRVICQRQELNQ